MEKKEISQEEWWIQNRSEIKQILLKLPIFSAKNKVAEN